MAHPERTCGQVRGADLIGIVALNVQHASRTRLDQQVEWLSGQDLGDVLVLSEVAGGDRCHHLVELLDAKGYAATHSDDMQAAYQVVVAFRRSSIDGPPTTLRRCARFVHAAAVTGGVEFEVVGLYVPSRGPAGQRNVAKRAFQREVREALPGIADRAQRQGHELVVAGDLNVIEPGHVPHHRLFGRWEYEFYQSFAELCGLRDAFRLSNGAELDHSWFGRRSGLGYRIDHIFVSGGLGVIECGYDHITRLSGLSDHAASKTRLRLSAARTTAPWLVGQDLSASS